MCTWPTASPPVPYPDSSAVCEGVGADNLPRGKKIKLEKGLPPSGTACPATEPPGAMICITPVEGPVTPHTDCCQVCPAESFEPIACANELVGKIRPNGCTNIVGATPADCNNFCREPHYCDNNKVEAGEECDPPGGDDTSGNCDTECYNTCKFFGYLDAMTGDTECKVENGGQDCYHPNEELGIKPTLCDYCVDRYDEPYCAGLTSADSEAGCTYGVDHAEDVYWTCPETPTGSAATAPKPDGSGGTVKKYCCKPPDACGATCSLDGAVDKMDGDPITISCNALNDQTVFQLSDGTATQNGGPADTFTATFNCPSDITVDTNVTVSITVINNADETQTCTATPAAISVMCHPKCENIPGLKANKDDCPDDDCADPVSKPVGQTCWYCTPRIDRIFGVDYCVGYTQAQNSASLCSFECGTHTTTDYSGSECQNSAQPQSGDELVENRQDKYCCRCSNVAAPAGQCTVAGSPTATRECDDPLPEGVTDSRKKVPDTVTCTANTVEILGSPVGTCYPKCMVNACT